MSIEQPRGEQSTDKGKTKGRGGSRKGHSPTFTREHTKDEIEKIRQAHTGKPLSKSHVDSISKSRRNKPLTKAHTDNISNGMIEHWKRRKAQKAQGGS